MNLHIISTGSKGNCYLLTDDQGRVVALDAGVGIKPIVAALNHDISQIDGALITHEHMDHCKAAHDLEYIGITPYMTAGTAEALNNNFNCFGIESLLKTDQDGNYDAFKVGNWYVRPFAVQHDAAEPVGYLLADSDSHRVLYATDTFYIRYKFERLTHIIVECNYVTSKVLDDDMASRKNRLLHSHMSLENLIKWLKSTDLTHCVKIVLVHLSDANSDEKKMVEDIERQTGIETIAATDGLDISFDLFPF